MVTSKRFCKDCGIDISNLGVNSIRCRNCQQKYKWQKAEHKRKKFFNKQKDERDNGEPACYTKLGTTDFNSHRKKDFKKELTKIEEEMKNLGLK